MSSIYAERLYALQDSPVRETIRAIAPRAHEFYTGEVNQKLKLASYVPFDPRKESTDFLLKYLKFRGVFVARKYDANTLQQLVLTDYKRNGDVPDLMDFKFDPQREGSDDFLQSWLMWYGLDVAQLPRSELQGKAKQIQTIIHRVSDHPSQIAISAPQIAKQMHKLDQSTRKLNDVLLALGTLLNSLPANIVDRAQSKVSRSRRHVETQSQLTQLMKRILIRTIFTASLTAGVGVTVLRMVPATDGQKKLSIREPMRLVQNKQLQALAKLYSILWLELVKAAFKKQYGLRFVFVQKLVYFTFMLTQHEHFKGKGGVFNAILDDLKLKEVKLVLQSNAPRSLKALQIFPLLALNMTPTTLQVITVPFSKIEAVRQALPVLQGFVDQYQMIQPFLDIVVSLHSKTLHRNGILEHKQDWRDAVRDVIA